MKNNKVSESVKDMIREISIRGRMALTITFLEKVLSKFNVDENEKRSLLNIFWDFVESEGLVEWVNNKDKVEVLTAIISFIDSEENSLNKFTFNDLPRFVLEMIYTMDMIPCEELYGSICNNSPLTLNYTIEVLELGLSNDFEIPCVNTFLLSSISENGGWGKPISRKIFMSY